MILTKKPVIVVCVLVVAAGLVAEAGAADRGALAGGRIAYQKNRGVGLILPDGSAKTTLYKHQGYRQCCLDWSPDGTQLLFTDFSNKDFSKQALLLLDETGTVVLAHQRFSVLDSAWSPDGDWVAFSAEAADRKGLWLVDENGNERQHVFDQQISGPLRWSFDGSNVSFQRFTKKGRGVVGYYSQVTHEVYDLTTREFDAYDGKWSPVENKLYFVHLEPGGDFGNFILYRMNDDGTEVEQLTGDDENVYGFEISPDGSTIAAIICCSDPEGRTEELYVMDADGGNRIRVDTDGTAGGVEGYLILHEWAPDGSVFIYEKSRNNAISGAILEQGLYSGTEAGAGTQLIDQDGITFEDWAPDGSAFATCTSSSRDLLLGVYDFDGSSHSTITSGCYASWGF